MGAFLLGAYVVGAVLTFVAQVVLDPLQCQSFADCTSAVLGPLGWAAVWPIYWLRELL